MRRAFLGLESTTELQLSFPQAAEPSVKWVWRGGATTLCPTATAPWTRLNYLTLPFSPKPLPRYVSCTNSPIHRLWDFTSFSPTGGNPSQWNSFAFPLTASSHQPDFSVVQCVVRRGDHRFHSPLSSYLKHTYSQSDPYPASPEHHHLDAPAGGAIQDEILWNRHQVKVGRKLRHGRGGYGPHGCRAKGAKSQRSLRDLCSCHHHFFPQVSLLCFHLLYPIRLLCLQWQGLQEVLIGLLLRS